MHTSPRCPRLALAILICVPELGCSSSGAVPPDTPPAPVESAASPEPAAEEAKPQQAPKPEDAPAAATASEPGRAQGEKDIIPDDYALVEADCVALGKQYEAAARADQVAGISPKVTEKQRVQAEENIDKVVSKLASQWIDSCAKSLVGKVVDRGALKCALAAKTVAAFQTCIGDQGHGKKPPGGKK